jgi:hypothetical protein
MHYRDGPKGCLQNLCGDDRIVRPELTDDFVEKMKAEGADIEYLKIDGAGHGVA